MDKIKSNDLYINNLIAIAQSKQNGKHFVIGNKQVILDIASIESLGSFITSIYNKICNDQTKWFNCLKDFSYKVYVRTDITDFFTKKINSFTEFHIPLDKFIETNLNDHPDFICENLYDLKLYVNATKSYAKQTDINGINICCNPVMGGGSTTHQVVQQNKLSHKISACILDSDYRYPSCVIGSTAQSVININDNDSSCVQHLILEQRELENLIPLSLLKKYFRGNRGQLRKIDLIEQIKQSSVNKNPCFYFDFKIGLRKSLFSCVDDQQEKQYWLSIIPDYNQFTCTNENCSKPSKCNNKHVDGFGSDLLQSISDYIEQNELIFSDIDSDLQPYWTAICQFLLSFFIAPLKRAA